MATTTLDLRDILETDGVVPGIVNKYILWKSSRSQWEAEKAELRNYIFATDTTKTTNSQLPWKNSTTLPKICQIRDNLHANYMAALFPNEDWFKWVAADRQSATKAKATVITGYMKNKLEQSHFRTTVSQLVLDYIDYGNCFAEVIFKDEFHTTPDGERLSIYTGPQLQRISPFDIVFNVTGATFKSTPKITRSILSLGQLKKMMIEQADSGWVQEAFNKSLKVRAQIAVLPREDTLKAEGFAVDGFSTAYQYFTSNTVEVLEFEGDIYDEVKDELRENRRVIIIDRSFIALDEPYSSWLGRSNKEHVGWRLRPDNLMAMGPLDNLVGMQYRMDHLENLRGDVFDQIAFPPVYQRGVVEDWEWGPGEKIFGDEESDVRVLSPDATALNADFQIPVLQEQMEEFAGAPRQAMGVRTPGEKTAFEVQSLENAAGRIFQNKVSHFEEVFLEPLLNQMLEAGRRNLRETDIIRSMDSDLGVAEFMSITQEDIQAKGTLVPQGARHFARSAQLVQNLNTFVGSAAYADPGVQVHVSGLTIAKTFQELIGLEKFDLVQPNVRVTEQMETQRTQQAAASIAANEAVIDPELEALEANGIDTT
jgi:hypothetical protein